MQAAVNGITIKTVGQITIPNSGYQRFWGFPETPKVSATWMSIQHMQRLLLAEQGFHIQANGCDQNVS